MSSIKDVQFAMNGESDAKVKHSEVDYVPQRKGGNSIAGSADESNKLIVFKLAKKNPSGVYIQGIDYVVNPAEPEKGPQEIRLLDGVASIWAKDQKDIPANRIGKLLRSIEFPKGTRFMYVPAFDKTKLEFMELCNHNLLNENKTRISKTEFFKYDPEAVEREKTDAIKKEIEILLKASQQPFEKMKRHAFYLGIRLNHEITEAPKSEEALRGEYLMFAKMNPADFEKSFDSKEVEMQYKVRTAIIDGKIDISRGDGRIYWGKNGGIVCNIPKSEKPITYLTELALTNSKEGKEFKQELERLST